MKILIGYSMRSGSTLLEHMLDGHSQVRAYGDLSSFVALVRTLYSNRAQDRLCVKPMDLLYLQPIIDFYPYFDKFVWLARDPRDSYLSTVESGYAYYFWLPGRRRCGIDIGLLTRWKRIYRHFFDHPDRWHLVRYEDLVANPDDTLVELLDYLDLTPETLFPFRRFKRRHGGDYKLTTQSNISARSCRRFIRELERAQIELFDELLGEEMSRLGYPLGKQVLEARRERDTGCLSDPILVAAP